MFWCVWNKLFYLVEFLSDIIVKRKDINFFYQFYVFLYGICVRNEGLLSIFDSMICVDFDEMKCYVLNYRDSEDNNIFYFLIFLYFFDKFVVCILEKFVENGMFINLKNKRYVIFLMVVVQ